MRRLVVLLGAGRAGSMTQRYNSSFILCYPSVDQEKLCVIPTRIKTKTLCYPNPDQDKNFVLSQRGSRQKLCVIPTRIKTKTLSYLNTHQDKTFVLIQMWLEWNLSYCPHGFIIIYINIYPIIFSMSRRDSSAPCFIFTGLRDFADTKLYYRDYSVCS